MLYKIKNASVSLGGEVILDHIDFEIKGREHIAVVGRNGCGKTTLLRLIAGELDLDADDKQFEPGIWTARNTSIGMLRQNSFSSEEKELTVEQLVKKNPTVLEEEYDRLFTGFGFEKALKHKKIGEFSGGEQTKIALIQLLLAQPDILLLDEPTNHLDIDTVLWLENYLKSYKKAVVMVSHDRFFLNQCANVVYELVGKKAIRYAGNYDAYKAQREKNQQIAWKNYIAQQNEIDRLEELIVRFKHKPTKASMARSKKKTLERMQKLEKPREDHSYCFIEPILPKTLGSKNVLEAIHLQLGYEEAVPLQEISLRVRRGQKIGILGANGIGKTTFLKTLMGKQEPLSGSCHLGNGVEVRYFDQHSGEDTFATEKKRVFEHYHDLFPKLTLGEVKTALGHYLFRGEDSARWITELSGGEKSRLALAEILESKPNLLLLDEPTNHMDLPAKETLESAFKAYKGTILFVSHDRYLIKEVADALLIFEKDKVGYYPFGYEHYLQKLEKNCKLEGVGGVDAVSVENTMLINGLHEVPEKKRIQSARLNTEQSFTDWQLELADKARESAQKAYECHVEEREEERYWMDAEYADCWKEIAEKLEAAYTSSLIEWYDKWLEYEEAFAHYKDYE